MLLEKDITAPCQVLYRHGIVSALVFKKITGGPLMPSMHNFIILFVFAFSLTALAQETSPHCYQFTASNVEAVEHDTDPNVSAAEIWCYQRVETPRPGLLIYNMDQGRAKPELTIFKGDDGYLVHSSLLAGKISTHRVKATEYNPFSVPLTEPKVEARLSMKLSAPIVESANAVLKSLLSTQQADDTPMTVAEGTFQAKASILPWRGYWWPQRGQTISGPLKKYDLFVKARTGESPNSARYERNHHGWTGEVWEGHCNGWAAAAILNEEPVIPRTDTLSGVTFSVLDLKGLLSERDFCVTHSFFGSRYRDASDNMSDIRPALFHKTLVYYIGSLGKPVATDYDRSATVNNAVISGYEMKITKTGSRTYKVKAVVSLHHYDKTKKETPGVAPAEAKRYSYTLKVNDVGEIISGSWLSGNPDFLWVPLSHTPCSKNNQKLDPNYIEEILNLP